MSSDVENGDSGTESVEGYDRIPIPKPMVESIAGTLSDTLDANYGDTLHTSAKRFRNSNLPDSYTAHSTSSALIALVDNADGIAADHDISVDIWNEDANKPSFIVQRRNDNEDDAETKEL